MPNPAIPRLRTWLVLWLVRLVTAAALAVDAYVHADLVTRYDPNQGGAAISQGDLFRIEAAVASFAALALVLTARRVIWILAVLVAASALGGLLLYRYFDPGALGPLPDMYEPIWYPQKSLAATAEATATVTALAGCVIAPSATERAGRARRAPSRGRSPRATRRLLALDHAHGSARTVEPTVEARDGGRTRDRSTHRGCPRPRRRHQDDDETGSGRSRHD